MDSLKPADIVANMVQAGIAKSALGPFDLLVRGALSGALLGFATSLTTNGFLLTRKLLKELEEAGLQVMQISVDRMTPSAITKKSFKTILPKLDYFKDSKISLHITGVICADTLPESKAVLETGLSRGIPTEVRLVHADPLSRFRVARGSKEELAT